MVRFIIRNVYPDIYRFIRFTFQYGQIYYFFALLGMRDIFCNLHSNMVRFIINALRELEKQNKEFTFQYGQIYYQKKMSQTLFFLRIYIPIWLDLLSIYMIHNVYVAAYLHSNMVRFIIIKNISNNIIMRYIYIPIWLDLLLLCLIFLCILRIHLHSNMVRFIIRYYNENIIWMGRFTFQYGQIYY